MQDDQFDFPIFKSLEFDKEYGRYLMPAVSRRDRKLIFIEFTRLGRSNIYSTREGLELVDQGNLKIIRAANGARFLFVQYPDGNLRCTTIKENTGVTLNLIYTANGWHCTVWLIRQAAALRSTMETKEFDR